MKTLPLHAIPADRMAAMSSRGAKELRAERIAQAKINWAGHDPTVGDGCGAMMVVGIIIAVLAIYAGLFLLWL